MDNWQQFWQQYNYAKPIATVLSQKFGVTFRIDDTGGGCICIVSDTLEGGRYILVGDGDGWEPLPPHDNDSHNSGYGVSVIDEQTGHMLASVSNVCANDPISVISLVRESLDLSRHATELHYLARHYDKTGNVSTDRFRK